MMLLEARDLACTFPLPRSLPDRLARRPRPGIAAVAGVTLGVARGETLGLVGESGCGKSTLARLIVGLHRPSAGSLAFDGTVVAPAVRDRPPALRRRLQMIFQDPYASLNPRWRVGDIIAEPLAEQPDAPPPAARREHAAELLARVGLSAADARRHPHEFSGGQRQRIAIARALSTGPDFLVCDEPTSALDVSVQAQVLNLMRDLQEAEGLTFLLISHNLAVIHHMANRIGVMYLGRLVEIGEKTDVFARPRHPYTRALLATLPRLDGVRRPREAVAGEVPSALSPPSGCHFHPRCPFARARCRAEAPALADGVACHGIAEGWIPS
ncbi:MAG: ABC transporter ATP-binding protein [Ferrovibrionaceae bacterium]